MEENSTLQAQNIIFANSLEGVGTAPLKDYLGHALCTAGSCEILFNGKRLRMSQGDLMIVRKGKLIEKVYPAPDFRVEVMYIAAKFVELCTPQSNYGTRGQLALFLNPIMSLTPDQFDQCRRNFDNLRLRIRQTNHHFYRDMLINKVQCLIIDFFDFHAALYREQDVSTQYAQLMNRFISLLESGTYREHREVTWYADQLCVTSKYLSEVAKSVSGYGANFWINRYTAVDISRLLRDKSISFVQISDLFHFSSPAYFSRYVIHNLGVNPTGYRG